MTAGLGLLLALAISACGSGSGSQNTTATISRAAFLKQAEAICTKGTKAINEDYGQWLKKPTPKGVNRDTFMNKVAEEVVIPVRQEELKRLRALGLPEEGRHKVEAFLAAMEDGIEQGERDRRSLRARGGLPYAFEEALNLSLELGLEPCFIG